MEKSQSFSNPVLQIRRVENGFIILPQSYSGDFGLAVKTYVAVDETELTKLIKRLVLETRS